MIWLNWLYYPLGVWLKQTRYKKIRVQKFTTQEKGGKKNTCMIHIIDTWVCFPYRIVCVYFVPWEAPIHSNKHHFCVGFRIFIHRSYILAAAIRINETLCKAPARRKEYVLVCCCPAWWLQTIINSTKCLATLSEASKPQGIWVKTIKMHDYPHHEQIF